MKRLIRKRPNAQQDLIDHYAYIARDKLEPADRFLTAAETTFERLKEMPGMGWRWISDEPRLADVRVYPLPNPFRKYLVFYRPIEEGIEILAVIHGARDWKKILGDLTDFPNPWNAAE